MTEFDDRMKRLIKCFGDNFYNEERIDNLWCKLRSKSATDFNLTIDKLISSEKTVPTPNKVMEVLYEVERSNNTSYKKIIIECDDCGGAGHVSKPIHGGRYTAAFRCHCDNSIGLSDKIPPMEVWEKHCQEYT